MQEMAVQCGLKIPSLGISVQHDSASLVMPNTYPRGGIFNPHCTAIKDTHNTDRDQKYLHYVGNSINVFSCLEEN